MENMSLARRIHFNSGHRYWNDDWTPEQNQNEFGLCTNPNGHGHSYTWDVFIQGPIDQKTGMILNLRDVDSILKQVTSPIDGQFINFVLPQFKTRIPTTELLLEYLTENSLRQVAKFPNTRLVKSRLFETEDLWVEWNA